MFEPNNCTGTFTGSVGYNPNVGPGGIATPAIPRHGRNGATLGSILVGHFSITIR
jgi:hypothetical protein